MKKTILISIKVLFSVITILIATAFSGFLGLGKYSYIITIPFITLIWPGTWGLFEKDKDSKNKKYCTKGKIILKITGILYIVFYGGIILFLTAGFYFLRIGAFLSEQEIWSFYTQSFNNSIGGRFLLVFIWESLIKFFIGICAVKYSSDLDKSKIFLGFSIAILVWNIAFTIIFFTIHWSILIDIVFLAVPILFIIGSYKNLKSINGENSTSKNIIFVNQRTKTKEKTDSVKIISVTPDTDLIDGKEQSFILKINYNLTTQKRCFFDIGFNTVEAGVDGFKSFKPKYFIIKKGSGNLTFQVTTVPKNWFSEGEFYVKVGLYIIKKFEWPRKELGMKLAGDSKVLLFNNENNLSKIQCTESNLNNSLALTQTGRIESLPVKTTSEKAKTDIPRNKMVIETVDTVENFKENFETNDFMFCINCGTKIVKNSNFCIRCGFNLASVKG